MLQICERNFSLPPHPALSWVHLAQFSENMFLITNVSSCQYFVFFLHFELCIQYSVFWPLCVRLSSAFKLQPDHLLEYTSSNIAHTFRYTGSIVCCTNTDLSECTQSAYWSDYQIKGRLPNNIAILLWAWYVCFSKQANSREISSVLMGFPWLNQRDWLKCRDLLTILSKCNIKQTVMPGKLVTTTQCLPNPALMFHSHNSSMIQAMQVRGVLWKYASNRLVFHEHESSFHLQYFLLYINGTVKIERFLFEQRSTGA